MLNKHTLRVLDSVCSSSGDSVFVQPTESSLILLLRHVSHIITREN